MDEEAAFVAAMIHDPGLTDTYRGETRFARVGADLAGDFLSSRGSAPDPGPAFAHLERVVSLSDRFGANPLDGAGLSTGRVG